MSTTIHNSVLEDHVMINGTKYQIITYIENSYCYCPCPWVTWILCGDSMIYQTRITKKTLEAAERTHKYTLEHVEELIRESEALK